MLTFNAELIGTRKMEIANVSIFTAPAHPPQHLLIRFRIAVLVACFSFASFGLSFSSSAQEKKAEANKAPADADVVLIVDAELLDLGNVAAAVDAAVNAEVEKVDNNAVVEAVLDPAVQNDPQLWLLSTYARVNTAFARRVCKLTPDEERLLALMTDAWIAQQMAARGQDDAPIQGIAAGIARFLRCAAAARPFRNEEQPQQVISRVKQAIDKQIDNALSEEHRETYRTEREARDKFRSQALASVLVAAIDDRVYLSTEQRQRLEAELTLWSKKDLYWQFYFQNQNYVPDLPTGIMSKVLNTEQLDALKGAQAYMYDLAQIELQMMQERPIAIER